MQPQHSKLAPIIRIVDAIVVGGSLWLLALLFGIQWDNNYNLAVAWSIGLFFFFGQSRDLYRSWRGGTIRQEVVRIWLAWMAVILGLLFLAYATKTSAYFSRRLVLSWFLVAPFSVIVWRASLQMILGSLREHGANMRHVAIVGARDLGAQLARTVLEAPWMGLRPIGFYDDRKVTGTRPLVNEPVQVIGNLETLIRDAREGRLDLVYITLPMRAEKRIQRIISELSDTTVSVCLVPDFFLSDLMNASWGSVGDIPTVDIFETPFYGVDGWVKRVEDFVMACIILLVTFIPMILIAIAVKVTSPGPALFKQHRYGLRGNKIEVWKFRTMKVCENDIDVAQATKSDPRVTPIGAFLRKTSLDELPQFINVLQGSMSIVGPRPHAIVHNEQYRKLISGYMLRHKVKPGITGLAQISGWRGETDTLDKMQKRVEYDLAYIRNWSLWLDFKIILMTLIKGFVGKNAY